MWGGGGGRVGLGGQGGCEQRIEVFVKIQKKKLGGGRGVGLGGGQGECERRFEVFGKIHKKKKKKKKIGLKGGVAQWIGCRISDQGVPGSIPRRCTFRCGPEQVTFTLGLVLVKPRKRWTDDRLGQTVTRLEIMLCLMC